MLSFAWPLLWATLCPSARLDTVSLDSTRWSLVRHDVRTERLELHWKDSTGQPWKRISRLVSHLDSTGRPLAFAMNAGMYHPDFSPVGLSVIAGSERTPLATDSAPGNFYLKPNGVFWVHGSQAGITETEKYRTLGLQPDLATQSGPLLLRAGQLHPRLDSLSRSLFVRSAIGIRGDSLFWAISDSGVNLHTTARLFRDVLHCTDALYLDGSIASLWVRGTARADTTADLGPILGIRLLKLFEQGSTQGQMRQRLTSPLRDRRE